MGRAQDALRRSRQQRFDGSDHVAELVSIPYNHAFAAIGLKSQGVVQNRQLHRGRLREHFFKSGNDRWPSGKAIIKGQGNE